MTDYNEKSVEELRELAKEREIEGRSKLTTKDDLVSALEESENGNAEAEELGHTSEASDPENPEVVANLSPEGQEALEELGPDSEAAELADLALDLESPSERVMTGALTEEQSKEQEELIGDLPEDYVGHILEDGTLASEDRSKRGSGPNGQVVQEDVIDFPPPIAEPTEEELSAPTRDNRLSESTHNAVQNRAAQEAYPDEGPTVASPRLYEQRGQLYTDGLSGQADHNTAMAYRLPDVRGGIFSVRGDEESPQQAEQRRVEEDRTSEE